MIARFGVLTLDSDRRQVTGEANGEIHLTPKAFDLLVLLVAEAPRVVRKTELHERLWPGSFVSDATLVGLVKEIRRALADHSSEPLIRTAHGVGYAFAGAIAAGASLSPGPVNNVSNRDHAASVWHDRKMPGWLVLILLLLGIEGLGFLMSAAFDRTIGLSGRFGWESPGAWFIWGVRSLAGPAVLIAGAATAVALLAAIARWSSSRIPVIRRGRHRAQAVMASMVRRIGLEDPLVRAQAVAIVGAVALALVFWRFSDLIHAFWSPVSDMLPEQLAPLRPESNERNLYGLWLDLLVVLLTFGSWSVFRLRARERINGRAWWPILGLVVLAAALLLDEIPYRVFYHSKFERADLGDKHCLVLGENRLDVLVHCPAIEPPRNRIVKHRDPALKRLVDVKSVYALSP